MGRGIPLIWGLVCLLERAGAALVLAQKENLTRTFPTPPQKYYGPKKTELYGISAAFMHEKRFADPDTPKGKVVFVSVANRGSCKHVILYESSRKSTSLILL